MSDLDKNLAQAQIAYEQAKYVLSMVQNSRDNSFRLQPVPSIQAAFDVAILVKTNTTSAQIAAAQALETLQNALTTIQIAKDTEASKLIKAQSELTTAKTARETASIIVATTETAVTDAQAQDAIAINAMQIVAEATQKAQTAQEQAQTALEQAQTAALAAVPTASTTPAVPTASTTPAVPTVPTASTTPAVPTASTTQAAPTQAAPTQAAAQTQAQELAIFNVMINNYIKNLKSAPNVKEMIKTESVKSYNKARVAGLSYDQSSKIGDIIAKKVNTDIGPNFGEGRNYVYVNPNKLNNAQKETDKLIKEAKTLQENFSNTEENTSSNIIWYIILILIIMLILYVMTKK